jgi:hypothetical protein
VDGPDRARGFKLLKKSDNFTWRSKQRMAPHGLESGLDRLDSVSVRIGNLVKDRRPPEAAALRAVLDKIADANNWQPSDQGRTPPIGSIAPRCRLSGLDGLL